MAASRIEGLPRPRGASGFSRRATLAAAQKWHIAVVVAYAVIAVLYTYPLIFHLRDSIGGVVDAHENYWSLWWIRQALLRLGENPFNGSYLFYPFGLPLYFHTLNPLNGLLSLPLQACCGVAAAYNLMVIFWFAFAATAAYALAWYLTRHHAAAFVAGLIYGFSPYAAYHLAVGQIPSLSLGWMALYLLALLKGLRERWIYLPLASIILVLVGLADWHYLSFSVFLTGLIGLYEAWHQRSRIVALFARLAVVSGLFLLFFSPILVPMFREYAREPYADRPLRHSILHSADLLAFFLPSIFHPIWGNWADQIFGRLVPENIVGGIATLGYSTLVLAGWAILRAWQRSALWLLIFGAGFLLALGPYLQVNGINSSETAYPIPMPFLLFRELPFMKVNRFASRFVVVAMLALAMLAAIGITCIWRRFQIAQRSAIWKAVAAGVPALLVLFEFWPRPFPVQSISGPEVVSPFYERVAAEPGDFAILEVPNLKQHSMFYQAHHGKRILAGRIAREINHPWRRARFFGPLLRAEPPEPEIGVDNSPEAFRAALSCQNIRYVVFYKHDLSDAERKGGDALQDALFADLAPTYEDRLLRAYGPFVNPGRDPYWTPARDWYPAEVSQAGVRFRWLQGNTGTLFIYPCGPHEVTLHLNVVSYAQDRTMEVRLNSKPAGRFSLSQDRPMKLDVPLALEPGENKVELRSVEPATSPASLGSPDDPRMLSLQVSDVHVTSSAQTPAQEEGDN